MGETAAAGGVFRGLGLRGVREIAAAATAGTAAGTGPVNSRVNAHTLLI